MSSVAIAAGAGVTAAPRRGQAVRKGYAASRQAYDARRRRNVRSAATVAYMAQIRRDPCIVCGGVPATGIQDADHIEALNAGGSDDWTNMAAACGRCNRARKDTPILHFLLRRAACSASPK